MDYEIVKLKEIADFNKESIGKNSNYEFINYLDTANITNGAIDTVVRIPIEEAPSRAKRIVHNNDIVYSTVRPNLCHYGILDSPVENMIVSTGFTVISCKDDVNPYYVYNYLIQNDITSQLHSIAENSTSAYPSIKPSDLENIEIKLPKLDIQNKIAKILTDIDKKIKINNEINNNLHELVKNEYYERFIVNKRDDWKEDTLGNYLSIDRGLSYKGQFLSDNGVPMINLGNVMPNGVFRIEKNKYYSGDFKEKVTTKVGDIVLANTDMTQNREVIGTPVIVPPIYDGKIIFSHHIYCLRDLKLPKMFIFYTLLTDDWNAAAGGNATGTTVLALPKNTIENYIITIPDNESLAIFDNIATSIQEKRELIILENIKLEELRDTLLPKLMNGEIDLDNIEI